MVKTAVIHYDSEYGMHVSTGHWKALTNTALVGKIQHLIRELDGQIRLQWRWIRGHTGHRGNEQADALASRGAGGMVKHLPVFSSTSQGLRRVKLSLKTSSQVPAGDVQQEPISAAASLPQPVVSWDALSQLLVDVASSLVGTCLRT